LNVKSKEAVKEIPSNFVHPAMRAMITKVFYGKLTSVGNQPQSSLRNSVEGGYNKVMEDATDAMIALAATTVSIMPLNCILCILY
jgi:hypothetical protein